MQITDFDDLLERFCIMSTNGLTDVEVLKILENQTSKQLMNQLIDNIIGGTLI